MTEQPESDKSVKIEIESLHFSYSDGKKENKVIENLNLTVHTEEFLSIVGASGCGKSTLLNIIAGLMPPSGGIVNASARERCVRRSP